jgi:signal transduction histidine kinase
LENALRYGGADIRVGVARVPGGYRVEVADDGPGMSADERERAFERFYRGAGASHDATGAGLGLPVAKALAEAHGGQILLASPPEGGLSATVVLPERAVSAGAA